MNTAIHHERGFTLIELLIVIAMIMLLAGLVVSVATQVYSTELIRQTRIHMEAIQNGLQSYHIQNLEYPFQKDPPTNPQPVKTVTEVVEVLVLGGHLTRKEAEENKLDGWGKGMVYLLYDWRKAQPTVRYQYFRDLPSGSYVSRVNKILASGAFDTGSRHPVIVSAGSDGRFGTNDDVINYL